MRIYLIIVLTICTCIVLLDSRETACFNFIWPGRGIEKDQIDNDCINNNNEKSDIRCTDIPILSSDQMPDTTKLLEKMNEDKNYTYRCDLASDSVCIKYLYIYNKAVINASYFCGKVIEDQAIAVTSGCYVSYTEGYTIEACVCEEKGIHELCNSTIRNTYSILTIFIATVPLFIYKIFNIP